MCPSLEATNLVVIDIRPATSRGVGILANSGVKNEATLSLFCGLARSLDKPGKSRIISLRLKEDETQLRTYSISLVPSRIIWWRGYRKCYSRWKPAGSGTGTWSVDNERSRTVGVQTLRFANPGGLKRVKAGQAEFQKNGQGTRCWCYNCKT